METSGIKLCVEIRGESIGHLAYQLCAAYWLFTYQSSLSKAKDLGWITDGSSHSNTIIRNCVRNIYMQATRKQPVAWWAERISECIFCFCFTTKPHSSFQKICLLETRWNLKKTVALLLIFQKIPQGRANPQKIKSLLLTLAPKKCATNSFIKQRFIVGESEFVSKTTFVQTL